MDHNYKSYNQYDVLKPHWGFWLSLLFLSRHVVGFVIVSLSGAGLGAKGGGVSRDAIELTDIISLIEPIYMFADVPALILLYSLGARVPKSGIRVRQIWRAGRALILLSIAAYMGLLVHKQGWDFASYTPASWIGPVCSLLVVAYVLKSRYLKDLFAQFPAAEDSAGDG